MSKAKLLAANGVIALALAGCQVQTREAAAPGTGPYRPPRPTTKDELIERVHKASDPMDSFTMRANLVPSSGNPDTGIISRYASIGAYILYQHPDHLRVTGQDPVISGTIFDMVSTGKQFRLSLPRRNRFVVGNNDAPPGSGNPLENIRPGAFLAAMILSPPDKENEITLLEESVKEGKPVYALLIARAERNGYRLMRSIYFDAYTLQIVGQRTFDSSGRIAGDATYSDWKDYGPAPFPSNIEIKGPQRNYEVGVEVLSLKMNPSDLTAQKFVLEQPAGSELQKVD
jgi:hypothetical protein